MCMGPTHTAVGALWGLAYAAALGLPPGPAVGCVALGMVTSGGQGRIRLRLRGRKVYVSVSGFSPDIDQSPWWGLLARLIGACTDPEHPGPMRHRGITHWWGIPVALAVASFALPAWFPLWAAHALILGWASHIWMDWVFGKAHARYVNGRLVALYRGRGVPMAPWWGHRGLGFKVGGRLERFTNWFITPATVVAVAALYLQGVIR